jgi:hypothetical protein
MTPPLISGHGFIAVPSVARISLHANPDRDARRPAADGATRVPERVPLALRHLATTACYSQLAANLVARTPSHFGGGLPVTIIPAE